MFSQPESEEEVLRNIRDAISLHLETLESEIKGEKLIEVELWRRKFPERSLGRNFLKSLRA